jgi:two-component system KDP operon response regulator KdpE
METYLQGTRILVIDDDVDMLQLVALMFARVGAQVFSAVGGRQGLRQFYTHQPDLVLIDMLMPELDGLEVCRRIREMSPVPIIMLTAMGRDSDIVRGLDCGADDYITKPFNAQVLLARARTVLRRAEPLLSANEPLTTYDDGYLAVDLRQRQARVQGESVKLSPTEYALLAFLVENAGQVLTYEQILDHVWDGTAQQRADYVHVYATYLRRKLEPDPSNPVYLVNEHGVGYRFEGKPRRVSRPMGALPQAAMGAFEEVAQTSPVAVPR